MCNVISRQCVPAQHTAPPRICPERHHYALGPPGIARAFCYPPALACLRALSANEAKPGGGDECEERKLYYRNDVTNVIKPSTTLNRLVLLGYSAEKEFGRKGTALARPACDDSSLILLLLSFLCFVPFFRLPLFGTWISGTRERILTNFGKQTDYPLRLPTPKTQSAGILAANQMLDINIDYSSIIERWYSQQGPTTARYRNSNTVICQLPLFVLLKIH